MGVVSSHLWHSFIFLCPLLWVSALSFMMCFGKYIGSTMRVSPLPFVPVGAAVFLPCSQLALRSLAHTKTYKEGRSHLAFVAEDSTQRCCSRGHTASFTVGFRSGSGWMEPEALRSCGLEHGCGWWAAKPGLMPVFLLGQHIFTPKPPLGGGIERIVLGERFSGCSWQDISTGQEEIKLRV